LLDVEVEIFFGLGLGHGLDFLNKRAQANSAKDMPRLSENNCYRRTATCVPFAKRRRGFDSRQRRYKNALVGNLADRSPRLQGPFTIGCGTRAK
ncbi:MAG: hypothetical protein ACYC7I_08225, partial [Gammaproteobacteria bacterium]